MKCYEITCQLPITVDLLEIQRLVHKKLKNNERPIRFVVTKIDHDFLYCDIGVLTDCTHDIANIFDFSLRPFERSEQFTVAMIVPTGIAAEVGGDAGDAQTAARLIAGACDRLITHPNVLNASDIMEITPNTLYVEGSILSKLMLGTTGIIPKRKNKILLAVDARSTADQELVDLSINSASAARLGLGASVDVKIIARPPVSNALYAENGRAIGIIDGLEAWYETFVQYADEYQAFAISSMLQREPLTMNRYYNGELLVNPLGGIEAMITHSLSLLLNVPVAHSPMNPTIQDDLFASWGVVEPILASEAISKTYLHCILKGLHQSPAIVNRLNPWDTPGVISSADINCLIQPDHCIGLPTLAALAQGIPVVAVRDERNIMKNDLRALPWRSGQLIYAANYLEAAGIVSALKMGIALDAVLRPIAKTTVLP